MSSPGLAEPTPEPGHQPAHASVRAKDAWARASELRLRTKQVMAEAVAAQEFITAARRRRRSSASGRKLLARSDYARLLARLETMPVIEQAKGIIMCQSRCGEGEAFDMLRRASQRSNVPVRELAAQIVARTAGTGTPPAGPDSEDPAADPAAGQPDVPAPDGADWRQAPRRIA